MAWQLNARLLHPLGPLNNARKNDIKCTNLATLIGQQSKTAYSGWNFLWLESGIFVEEICDGQSCTSQWGMVGREEDNLITSAHKNIGLRVIIHHDCNLHCYVSYYLFHAFFKCFFSVCDSLPIPSRALTCCSVSSYGTNNSIRQSGQHSGPAAATAFLITWQKRF